MSLDSTPPPSGWLARVPLQLRIGTAWLLLWLVCMSAARLAFDAWFGRALPDQEGLAAALWLGLRFDLRLALWCVLPLLLLGCWDVAAPWSRLAWVRRLWQLLIALAATAIGLIYVVDAGHYSYLTQRINATVFNYAQDASTSAGMVWATYPVLRIVAGLLLFVLLFSLVSARLMAYAAQAPVAAPAPRRWQRGLRHSGWTLLTLFGVVLGILGKWSLYPLRWSDAQELRGGAFRAALALNPVLNLYDTRNFTRDNPDIEAVRRYYPLMADFLGVDKPDVGTLDFSRTVAPKPQALPHRLNVVVVILESYSGYKSSVFGNPLDASPEIARLAKDGILFRRLFSAHPGTARGVFASLSGIPDVQVGDTASRDQQAVEQHLLMNDFSDHSKWYFIGGSTTWGNVRGFLKRSMPELHIVEEGQYQAPVNDVWGISDHDLFKEAIRHLNAARQSDPRPFFSVIQTSSNHRPYTVPQADLGSPAKPGPFKLREATPEQLGAAGFISLQEFNAFRYLDWSVGRFFEMARQQPWFDDTVFVLYGDHGITGQAGANMPAYFNPLSLTTGHNMLLLYAPKWLKPRQLDFPANQVDIMPTVAGLFDRPYLNTTLGRDLLDPRFDASRLMFNVDHGEGPRLSILTPERHYSVRADGSGARSRGLQGEQLVERDPAQDQDLQQLTLGWYETARYLTRHNPARKTP